MASSMSVLDKPNPTLWLATLVGKMFCMSCPAELPTVSQRCPKIPKDIWKISEDITHLAPVPSCAFPLHFLLMGLLAFFAGRSGNSREYIIILMSFVYFFLGTMSVKATIAQIVQLQVRNWFKIGCGLHSIMNFSEFFLFVVNAWQLEWRYILCNQIEIAVKCHEVGSCREEWRGFWFSTGYWCERIIW